MTNKQSYIISCFSAILVLSFPIVKPEMSSIIISLSFCFLIVRNQYAFIISRKALKAIFAYTHVLIENRCYDRETDYFDKMKVNMTLLAFLRPFEFGKFGAVKKEYRELLEPYFE